MKIDPSEIQRGGDPAHLDNRLAEFLASFNRRILQEDAAQGTGPVDIFSGEMAESIQPSFERLSGDTLIIDLPHGSLRQADISFDISGERDVIRVRRGVAGCIEGQHDLFETQRRLAGTLDYFIMRVRFRTVRLAGPVREEGAVAMRDAIMAPSLHLAPVSVSVIEGAHLRRISMGSPAGRQVHGGHPRNIRVSSASV